MLHTILCLALVFWFSLQMDYAENCICVYLGILLVYLFCIWINSVLQDVSVRIYGFKLEGVNGLKRVFANF